MILFSLANKHGIFDHQSVVPSVSTSTEVIDPNNDSNVQHPFTVISTLTTNNPDELISSSPSPSPSTPIIQNNSDEHDNELGSLTIQMNGVIAGDDDDDNNHNNNNNNNDDDDDEQDGTSSNRIMNLPQQIATILSNDNTTHLSHIKSDDDQQVITTNHFSRQSSTKVLEDFCEICQKHFCNKYYLRVSFNFYSYPQIQIEIILIILFYAHLAIDAKFKIYCFNLKNL